MISAITGRLVSVNDRGIILAVGQLHYELLIPNYDLQSLGSRIGEDLTFHTIFYLEGDAARGNLEPRLIGFSNPRDKAFFEKFTTVKGIGTKTALRALSVPAAQIAAAIEARDARALTSLNGIGKRTAELIIAELSGKVAAFAAGAALGADSSSVRMTFGQSDLDAINALVSLGERRSEAERLLQVAKQQNPSAKTTDALLREMLRLRSA